MHLLKHDPLEHREFAIKQLEDEIDRKRKLLTRMRKELKQIQRRIDAEQGES